MQSIPESWRVTLWFASDFFELWKWRLCLKKKGIVFRNSEICLFFWEEIWNASLCRPVFFFFETPFSTLWFPPICWLLFTISSPLSSRTCCVCRASRRCWGVSSGTSSSVWPSCGTPSSPTACKRRFGWWNTVKRVRFRYFRSELLLYMQPELWLCSQCFSRLHWASFSVQRPQRLRCSGCMPQIELIRIFGRTLSKLVQVEKNEKSRARSHGSMKVLDQCYKVPRCHSKVSKMLPLSAQKRPIRGALVVPVAQPWTPRHVAALSASGQGGQELWRFSSCAWKILNLKRVMLLQLFSSFMLLVLFPCSFFSFPSPSPNHKVIKWCDKVKVR